MGPTSRPSDDVANGRVIRELPVAPALLISRELAQQLPVILPQRTRREIAQMLPFVALSSILGWKQKLPAGRRAVHQIKSWHPANNLRLTPCAACGGAIPSRFRPLHVVT